jgi:TonB family protein
MNKRSHIIIGESVALRAALIVLTLGGWSGAHAQSPSEYAAPIEWRKYRTSTQAVTVDFPKFPTADTRPLICQRQLVESYFAYADQSVYQLSIYSRLKADSTSGCRVVSRFGEKSLQVRLRELFNGRPLIKGEAKIGDSVLPAYDLTLGNSQYRIIDDMKNGKWVELSVTYRVPDSRAIERFFSSLALKADESAIDIQGGWANTLGDDPVPGSSPDSGSDNESDLNFHLLYKPKARYTDAARNADVQGTVRLKVTLLNNGGIGNVTVVNGLDRGLTEQAITAARRLVFLPKVNKGQTVSVIITVDYGFNIY